MAELVRDDELIELPPAAISQARAWAETLYARGIGNTTGVNYRKDSYFFGYVGEQGVRRWLQRFDKLHRHRVCLTGRSELSEFIVWRQAIPLLLEVKARTKAEHSTFMVPVVQALHGDLFVGVRIEKREPYVVRIMGTLRRSEVEALPIADFGYGPTRSTEFSAMHPPSELAETLDTVRIIITQHERPNV